jgi:hypothetical protein
MIYDTIIMSSQGKALSACSSNIKIIIINYYDAADNYDAALRTRERET